MQKSFLYDKVVRANNASTFTINDGEMYLSIDTTRVPLTAEIGGVSMEPIMCPFCGSEDLLQDDDYAVELEDEYWTVRHWECLECTGSFDKIDITTMPNMFEKINESTIH